jgi:hypothetical protein
MKKNDRKSPSSSSSRSPPAKGGKEPREIKRDRHYYKNQIRLHRDQHNLQEYREEGNEYREEEDESHGASTMFAPNERTDTLELRSLRVMNNERAIQENLPVLEVTIQWHLA